MVRSTVHSRPTLQLVLQGEARQFPNRLRVGGIAHEVLDQPGPLIVRVAVADWQAVRTLAAACGYARPDFFAQSEATGKDPFRLHWLGRKPAATR